MTRSTNGLLLSLLKMQKSPKVKTSGTLPKLKRIRISKELREFSRRRSIFKSTKIVLNIKRLIKYEMLSTPLRKKQKKP
jgi:hypothetical protein